MPANTLSQIGTPPWTCPELLLRGKYSVQSDIWSLSTILIEVSVSIGFPPDSQAHQGTLQAFADWYPCIMFADPVVNRTITCDTAYPGDGIRSQGLAMPALPSLSSVLHFPARAL